MSSYDLHGVTKTYGDGARAIRAVDGIDLHIASGEFVVIEGPSGSGKSTLLQLLGALDRPSAGSVMFDGGDLALLPNRKLADLRLRTFGFVFQQFNLVPTLSALENVETALAPLGGGSKRRRERARRMLDGVGLTDRARHLPSQLSGGEQQRVAIARALSTDPQVILADEPTGNLDTRTGQEIMGILRRLSDESAQTVVLITHDPDIAASAPRVVRFRDGRVVADEAGAQLARPERATASDAARRVVVIAPSDAGPAAVHASIPEPARAAPTTPDAWIDTATAPSAPGEALLRSEGVVKHYVTENEDVVGIDGVSLTVNEGEFVAITGPSGSGKTTLLNCLSGLDRIDRGRVLIAGHTIHDLSDKEQSRLRSEVMGFIFQSWNLVPVFSAVENVELPLLLNGVKPNEARVAAAGTLERIGLGHRLNHHPNALSGGEQQRVAIARALAAGPALVWADEPTGNLDSQTAESVMRLLRELNHAGLAIVLVTHDESIADQATRRIYMRDGRLLADMTRRDAALTRRAVTPVAPSAAPVDRPKAPAVAPIALDGDPFIVSMPTSDSLDPLPNRRHAMTKAERREAKRGVRTAAPPARLEPPARSQPPVPAEPVADAPVPADGPHQAADVSEAAARSDPSPQPRSGARSPLANGTPEPVRYEDLF